MRDPYGPQWQPIEKLDAVLDLVRGMTEETREQRGQYRESGFVTLDGATISRIRRAYADAWTSSDYSGTNSTAGGRSG